MNGALLIGAGLAIMALTKKSAKVQDLTDDERPLIYDDNIEANVHNNQLIPGVKIHPVVRAHTWSGTLSWGIRSKGGIWFENYSDRKIYIFRIEADYFYNKKPIGMRKDEDNSLAYYGQDYYNFPDPIAVLPKHGKLIETPGTSKLLWFNYYGQNSNYNSMDGETMRLYVNANKIPADNIDNYRSHANKASQVARCSYRILWGYDPKAFAEDRARQCVQQEIPTVIYAE